MTKYLRCISGEQICWHIQEDRKSKVKLDTTDAVGYMMQKEKTVWDGMLYKNGEYYKVTTPPTFISEPILFWKDNEKYKEVFK